jgi:hypothetical protein
MRSRGEKDVGLSGREGKAPAAGGAGDLPGGTRAAKILFERPDHPDRRGGLLSGIEGKADRPRLLFRSRTEEARDVLAHLLLDEGNELQGETSQHPRGVLRYGNGREEVGRQRFAGDLRLHRQREERLLRGGVAKERRRRDAQARADVGERRPVKPALRERAPRVRQDLLP